jgi:hypothetical protein
MTITMAKLFLLRIQDAAKVNDTEALKIFGVRLAKFLPKGWVHFNEATPSKDLLFKIKKLEKNKQWNKETFKTHYVPFYLKEVKQNPKAKEELKKIIETIRSGKNVYYACYCGDYTICHRSLVGEIIKRQGIDIEYM